MIFPHPDMLLLPQVEFLNDCIRRSWKFTAAWKEKWWVTTSMLSDVKNANHNMFTLPKVVWKIGLHINFQNDSLPVNKIPISQEKLYTILEEQLYIKWRYIKQDGILDVLHIFMSSELTYRILDKYPKFWEI